MDATSRVQNPIINVMRRGSCAAVRNDGARPPLVASRGAGGGAQGHTPCSQSPGKSSTVPSSG